MARLKGFYIDPDYFRQIDEYIQDNRHIEKNFKFGMDAIVMLYAEMTVAEAQRRSLGPVDPLQRNRGAAWKIPVRRISGDYFSGWYSKREGLANWIVSNTSREAFFIEFGINHPATTGRTDSAGNLVRIRRPILKISVLQAINTANKTRLDLNGFARMLSSTAVWQSPALMATPTHGADRTYPVSSDLASTLRGMSR